MDFQKATTTAEAAARWHQGKMRWLRHQDRDSRISVATSAFVTTTDTFSTHSYIPSNIREDSPVLTYKPIRSGNGEAAKTSILKRWLPEISLSRLMTNLEYPAARRLLFFPESLPDETLFSRVSRYHLLSAEESDDATFMRIFGTPANGVDFTDAAPLGIKTLVKQLPGNREARLVEILVANTFVPFVMPVLSSTSLSYSVPKFNDNNICPSCVGEDEATSGVPYLHRSHQLPAVTACWRHGKKLIDSCSRCLQPFRRLGRFLSVPLTSCSCGWNLLAGGNETSATAEEQIFAKNTHRVFDELTHKVDLPGLLRFFELYVDQTTFGTSASSASHNLTVGIAKQFEKDVSSLEIAMALVKHIQSGRIKKSWVANINPAILERNARRRESLD